MEIPDHSDRKRWSIFVILLVFFAVICWPAISIPAFRKIDEYRLPRDLRGRVSLERVRALEAATGEKVTSAEDYNRKSEFVHALAEVAPVMWKVRKSYYRDIPQQEFEEKLLGFVADLDPHSSYEPQSEVLEAIKKLKEQGGGPTPDLLDPGKASQKIEASVFAGRYGLIKIKDFNDLEANGFQAQLTAATNAIWGSAPFGKIDGVVIDLRGNPGGFLRNATILLSAFVKKPGVLLITEKNYNSAAKTKVERVFSDPDPVGVDNSRLRNVPVVVLVDAGSASCSEIVAGVLQHYKIGVVASKDPRTFGKGVIQSVSLLKNGRLGQLTLTTHEYFIGANQRVQGYGVCPDIRLKGTSDDEPEFERDLDNPILPTGAAAHFVPMRERDPELDKQGREMLKALKMDYK